MKRQDTNYAPRIAIIFLSLLFLVNLSLGIILLSKSREATKSQIEGRMTDMAKTAAAMLNGDALKGIGKEDLEGDACKEALRVLAVFQNNFDMAYIYCFRENADGRFEFILDPGENSAEFGELLETTEAMKEANKGHPSVDKMPVTDRWGRFYSAYCPVLDSSGQTAALVGVDFYADRFDRQLNTHSIVAVILSALTILSCILVSYIIIRYQSKKIRVLREEMDAFEKEITDLTREVLPESEAVAAPGSGEEKPSLLRSVSQTENLRNAILRAKSELQTYIRATEKTAYTDVMTGAGNRASYAERTEAIDQAIELGGACFSIAVFDINGLKTINDTQGHEIGDRCIKIAAKAITNVFGAENTYRIGGDEFIIIVNWTDQALMHRMFEKVDRVIEAGTAGLENGAFVPTVSKGFSEYDPYVDKNYLSVFLRADNDMYRDKSAYYDRKR